MGNLNKKVEQLNIQLKSILYMEIIFIIYIIIKFVLFVYKMYDIEFIYGILVSENILLIT